MEFMQTTDDGFAAFCDLAKATALDDPTMTLAGYEDYYNATPEYNNEVSEQ
jgi:hypothetical protein